MVTQNCTNNVPQIHQGLVANIGMCMLRKNFEMFLKKWTVQPLQYCLVQFCTVYYFATNS